MTEMEKRYDLAAALDREAILKEIAQMAPNSTLTFLLLEAPTQGDFGKIGYKANNVMPPEQGDVYLDIVSTEFGLMLYATCSLLEENDQE